MRLDVEHFSKVENSFSWDSHLCAGTQGRYFRRSSTSHVGLSKGIDEQSALVLCGDRVAPRDREGRKLLYLLLLPDSFHHV